MAKTLVDICCRCGTRFDSKNGNWSPNKHGDWIHVCTDGICGEALAWDPAEKFQAKLQVLLAEGWRCPVCGRECDLYDEVLDSGTDKSYPIKVIVCPVCLIGRDARTGPAEDWELLAGWFLLEITWFIERLRKQQERAKEREPAKERGPYAIVEIFQEPAEHIEEQKDIVLHVNRVWSLSGLQSCMSSAQTSRALAFSREMYEELLENAGGSGMVAPQGVGHWMGNKSARKALRPSKARLACGSCGQWMFCRQGEAVVPIKARGTVPIDGMNIDAVLLCRNCKRTDFYHLVEHKNRYLWVYTDLGTNGQVPDPAYCLDHDFVPQKVEAPAASMPGPESDTEESQGMSVAEIRDKLREKLGL